MGFGTFQLSGEECEEAVEYALKAGYRHIDTADAYGNHREVALGIKRSGIAREEFFLTTKLKFPNAYTKEAVARDSARFLEELQTEYIDLLLIHWPNREVPFAETLGAMNELKERGVVRAIGVSNFTPHHLDDALKAGVEIVNNQVEVRPTFNQKALREYCAAKNISITGYSSLKRGETEVPLINELAGKYDKSAPQIILNWVALRGMVTIPKSAHKERIKENLGSLDFEIAESDLARIDALPQGVRGNDPSFGDFGY
jgi:diketogulonate reductase-like aldo/keto reductase